MHEEIPPVDLQLELSIITCDINDLLWEVNPVVTPCKLADLETFGKTDKNLTVISKEISISFVISRMLESLDKLKVEGDKIIKTERKTTKVLSNCFSNIVKNLDNQQLNVKDPIC